MGEPAVRTAAAALFLVLPNWAACSRVECPNCAAEAASIQVPGVTHPTYRIRKPLAHRSRTMSLRNLREHHHGHHPKPSTQ